jgi:hypothetical protein
VSQWNDKSGNGRNFTQATAANQPTTAISTQNSLNVLDFDGNDRLLSSSPAATWLFMVDGTDHLIASVWRAGNVSDPNALYTLMGSTRTGAQTGVWIAYDDRLAASRNNRLFHAIFNGATVQTVANNISGDNAQAANTWSALTILADPDNATAANRSRMFVDSGSAIANNTQTNAAPSSIANNLLIGASTNDAHLVGSIAEIIMVSGSNATEANRLLLRDYLRAKWGI